MRRFSSFVLILLVLVVCVGFLRGWFSVSSNKELLGDNVDVRLKMDSGKMKQDANAVEQKTKELFQSP